MAVDVVIGGQGGDEGKGKIAAYLAISGDYSICMRVSSPQAGHSIHYNGKRVGLAILPCGLVNPEARLLVGAGGLISLERLLTGFKKMMPDGTAKFIEPEIPSTGVTPERLGIDYRATVVTPEHKKRENENSHLMKTIGSVGEGISQCRVEKIMRGAIAPVIFAKDCKELAPYLTDTKQEVYQALKKGKNILLEGDHGAKLDLIHGEYPMVTTRAVNAAGFLSEAGIGPRDVRDVYVILKPYTTRVGPGHLEKEIFDFRTLEWAEKFGGETGTVSGRKRRLGHFEFVNVREVIRMNSATKLVFTHMDLPDFAWNQLGYDNGEGFLAEVQKRLCDKWPNPKIALLSYGPKESDVKPYQIK